MSNEYITIYYWPDGCWCDADDLHQMTHKSDDYAMVQVPADSDEASVDECVRNLL